jgi:GTP-binding protein
MFVDTAKVFISAGKGGDGAVSFRHEIYVEKGGPDGGDGGKGGDVIFQATSELNTLVDFRYKPELRAKPGSNGSKRNRHGASGDDLIVKVPVGTVVTKDGMEIADFTQEGQSAIVAKGGDGGYGNAHFKSSTRQTPRIAEKGEPGESFEAELELKLLADVGLIGFPNVGKSTFLSVVSNAKPEMYSLFEQKFIESISPETRIKLKTGKIKAVKYFIMLTVSAFEEKEKVSW